MELTRKQLIALSEEYESDEGLDSISTIIEKYEKTSSGTYKCCWPGCEFTRQDPVLMWKHIHFSRMHMRDLTIVYSYAAATYEEVLKKYIIVD